MSTQTKIKAVDKLQASRLRPTQLELMGDDVDLRKFYLALGHKSINILEAVRDVEVERTIEGASTVTVSILDRDRLFLQSGLLHRKLDIEIDGLFFRFEGFRKSGTALDLVFEDREVSIARTYNRPIKQTLKTSRVQTTRAEFALRMLREIKELPPIPYVIPELHKTQDISGATDIVDQPTKKVQRQFGIPKHNSLKVKGSPMTEEQRKNANTILDVGSSMELPRRELVMSIMCAIQESTILNLLPGKPGAYNHLSSDAAGNPVGVFQQIKKWGWPASRDVAKDARGFFDKLDPYVKVHSNVSYFDAIEHVQGSGNPQGYAAHRLEAERIVGEYGWVGGPVADANTQWTTQMSVGDYEFYRGVPPTSSVQKRKKGKTVWGKESTWDCWQRLAAEVQWRAFFVSGVFYFISEDDLFRSQPIATIDEDSPGIDLIDGDYTQGKKVASLTVQCRMSKWAAPPGSVIAIKNMGPMNGRWLVNDVRRSLFDPNGTIILKKPLPRLPEPAGSNLSSIEDQVTWTGGPRAQPDPGTRQWKTETALVQPVPRTGSPKIAQGVHSTVGLAGKSYSYFKGAWPSSDAVDFGGNAGAPVLAVESGKVVHLSGHDPSLGPSDPVLGAHGPFGWSLYLLGDSGTEYYYTHLGTRSAVQGQRVSAGQQIAAIGNYAKWGGVNHVHVGVNPGSKGHPDIHDLMAAPILGGPGTVPV